ncbi:hypothetical protein [Heyndrickxia oleronia]|uniref:hypothetical protein n=1 Tax=Heyndrickxia oleronia TaxID=38875 RepID=UPI001C0EC57F|nr:hypothetical protein [Heyndrickxia oleronia]MBU5211053.1 hypothetical protein [Heyndrickxia oleronia]
MEQVKPLPNDKRTLLEGNNYEMYNLDLMRKVFPRIIAEHDAKYQRKQRKPQIRDIVTLYFYLLSYVDGKHTRSDGTMSERFGASFPSRDKISSELGIDERRIKPLADILETNGLIRQKIVWNGKWYFPSFCPRISEDGYLVDENGQKIKPDLSLY